MAVGCGVVFVFCGLVGCGFMEGSFNLSAIHATNKHKHTDYLYRGGTVEQEIAYGGGGTGRASDGACAHVAMYISCGVWIRTWEAAAGTL